MKAIGLLSRTLCKLLLPFLILPQAFANSDERAAFTFNVISDIPYNAQQETLLSETIVPALLARPGPFLMHLGDINSGSLACSDLLLDMRAREIRDMHPEAVFFTPGDNDWTDCDRKKTGAPTSEIAKLDQIRRLFYQDSDPYPSSLTVKSQPLYPENKRWIHKGIPFATLHVVGTNNGRAEILEDPLPLALAHVAARDAANIAWLDLLFEAADRLNAPAVIVGMQGDPSRAKYDGICSESNPQKCNGFAKLNNHLRQKAGTYGKPVLLIHGDTSPYCTDKGFGGKEAPLL